MKNTFATTFSILAFTICSGTAASAATINLSIGGSGGAGLDAGFSLSGNASTEDTFATVSDSRSTVGIFGSAGATADASADSETGELKFDVTATRNGEACVGCIPGAGASADASITESFTLTGSGTFTALMDYDANWNSDIFNFNAELIVNNGPAFSDGAAFSSLTSPIIDAVSGRLSVTQEFDVEETEVSVTWRILGDTDADGRPGQGQVSTFLDASNTALISFTTTGTLTATPSASNFLSNPSFDNTGGGVSPVPLPAGFILLLSGLAGITGLKRWKQFTA